MKLIILFIISIIKIMNKNSLIFNNKTNNYKEKLICKNKISIINKNINKN